MIELLHKLISRNFIDRLPDEIRECLEEAHTDEWVREALNTNPERVLRHVCTDGCESIKSYTDLELLEQFNFHDYPPPQLDQLIKLYIDPELMEVLDD